MGVVNAFQGMKFTFLKITKEWKDRGKMSEYEILDFHFRYGSAGCKSNNNNSGRRVDNVFHYFFVWGDCLRGPLSEREGSFDRCDSRNAFYDYRKLCW